jgi:checkpoint serine/threonine-protein kinase
VVSARTRKNERVFADLEAVYPNPNAISEEYSFDELRARQRGWLDMDWRTEREVHNIEDITHGESEQPCSSAEAKPMKQKENIAFFSDQSQSSPDSNGAHLTSTDVILHKEDGRDGRSGRPQKIKVKEIKLETQTSKCFGVEEGLMLNHF